MLLQFEQKAWPRINSNSIEAQRRQSKVHILVLRVKLMAETRRGNYPVQEYIHRYSGEADPLYHEHDQVNKAKKTGFYFFHELACGNPRVDLIPLRANRR